MWFKKKNDCYSKKVLPEPTDNIIYEVRTWTDFDAIFSVDVEYHTRVIVGTNVLNFFINNKMYYGDIDSIRKISL